MNPKNTSLDKPSFILKNDYEKILFGNIAFWR